jgi:hypothetical protein
MGRARAAANERAERIEREGERVEDRGEGADVFRAAQRAAAVAHEAVGDAEDDLAVAEAEAALEKEGSSDRDVADERVAHAERAWLQRQTDAQDASVAREEARADLHREP